jgi:RNA polymerase sigma-70 factor (ECF subfamily)
MDAPFRAHLASGDMRRAGEWLVQRHASEVLGLCAAMVRDRHAAEDLTQDVFGRAFASLAEFRGEASARTWLLAIARNRCLDHLRRARRDPWAGTAPDDIEPDVHADDAPLPPERLLYRDDVEAALEALAEGDRALVVLRFRHGLEYPELAVAFGLREGTVRMRISRALARMREALLERDFDGMAAPMAGGSLDEEATPVPAPRTSAPRQRTGAGAPAPREEGAAPPRFSPAPARPAAAPLPSGMSAPRPPAPAGPPPPMGAPPPARRAEAPRPFTWADQIAAALRQTASSATTTIQNRLLDLASRL